MNFSNNKELKNELKEAFEEAFRDNPEIFDKMSWFCRDLEPEMSHYLITNTPKEDVLGGSVVS